MVAQGTLVEMAGRPLAAVPPAVAPSAPVADVTLAAKAQRLRDALGLRGSIAEVATGAARELGVAREGLGLVALVDRCVEEIEADPPCA